MMAKVYKINQGVNRSIEFKGLKAQYIWYLGGGVLALLILFATLYILGVNTYITLGLVLFSGGSFVTWIYRLNNKYGEFGLMKKAAQRMIPTVIRCSSRKVFFKH